MRITNSMIQNNVMYNINNNLYTMNTIYSQLSTGKTIQSPSDDPIGASNAMKYEAYLSDIEQYTSNANDAYAWMEVTESALESLDDCVTRTNELMLQASSETVTQEDREKIQAEVNQLMDEIIEIANSDYAGTYIFAGYESSTPPFEVEETVIGPKVTYQDTYLCLEGSVSSTYSDTDIETFYNAQLGNAIGADEKEQIMTFNINANSDVDVNIEGYELIGESLGDLYETCVQFDLYLSGDTNYKYVDTTTVPVTVITEEISTDNLINALSDSQDSLLSLHAEMGAKMNYVEMTINRLSDDELTYKTLLSETEDADIAGVSVELSQAEYVYEASLSSASKIIMPSLVDFMR